MNDKPNRSRGLGRGLSALMADVPPPVDPSITEAEPRSSDRRIPIEQLHPNPNQPRRSFNDEALSELASSIREKGVIQPLIVRESKEEAGKFEIVAGERRWRAAQRAQLHDVPVLVRDFDDTEVLEVAIIENIQRADLNAVDEANGYHQLMKRFGHTQDQLAQALGKSRSHIANMMRLLTLPDSVQDLLVTGSLTAGHARALVGRDDAETLAKRISDGGLSVREAEALTRKPQGETSTRSKRSTTASEKDADTRQIESELSAHLGMKVSIDHKDGSEAGTVSLTYRSLQQLDDLLRHLSRD